MKQLPPAVASSNDHIQPCDATAAARLISMLPEQPIKGGQHGELPRPSTAAVEVQAQAPLRLVQEGVWRQHAARGCCHPPALRCCLQQLRLSLLVSCPAIQEGIEEDGHADVVHGQPCRFHFFKIGPTLVVEA